MSKPTSIQLHIPTPCHEDWQQMTPCERGRFCTSCRKTVVDFSSWSDRALYEFFTKNTAPVCGRFLNTQLERPIHIPYQPHSRLYRLAIVCGLTLMFTQMPEVHARVKAPSELLSTEKHDGDDDKKTKNGTGSITGNVKDEKGEPIIGAIIEVNQNGIRKGGAVSDLDGNYTISQLQPGNYILIARYAGYATKKIENIQVEEKSIEIDINFQPNTLDNVLVGYVAPLIGDVPLRNSSLEPLKHPTREQFTPSGRKIKTEPIKPNKIEPKLNVQPKEN